MERYSINPQFDSALMSTIFSLESLRYEISMGTTPKWLFYDLREILHIIESLCSARIEGNHTALIEAATNAVAEDEKKDTDSLAEIENIRDALGFIDSNFKEGSYIALTDVREIHKIAVKGLHREGSETPGVFRQRDNICISGSDCVVSPHLSIEADMQELLDYINKQDDAKNSIIKIACAHHRLVAIHPFDNGNGRTARLLTYAMLIKYGFVRNEKAILNPSSIFCMNREKYYKMLGLADTMQSDKIEEWCLYVAEGIQEEMEKTRKLLDKKYAVDNIIAPALNTAKGKNLISDTEHNILKIAVEKDVIQASDVRQLFGSGASDATRCSRCLSKMIENGLLMHPPKNSKKYVIRFYSKILLPGVLSAMDNEGLIDSTN